MNTQQEPLWNRYQKQHRGAAIIDRIQDDFREDGYSNLLNKYGTMQDSSTAYQYDQEDITDDMELFACMKETDCLPKL